MATLSQGGTLYYLRDDGHNRNTREGYLQYVQDIFKLTGNANAVVQEKPQAIMGIETALARVLLSRVTNYTNLKRKNKDLVTIQRLLKNYIGCYKENFVSILLTSQGSIIKS